MGVEVGQIVRGTVVRLLDYGALVRLDDGTTGLVHISEIDPSYVRNVSDFMRLNDEVIVKVLAAGERGKIELSVKQAKAALAEGGTEITALAQAPAREPAAAHRNGDGDAQESMMPRREGRASFEDKMGDFMRSSAERLGDIKRNVETKRGGKNTR
ncbi:MAG TPA: S1 RNA-binding domain-containing protein [Abditibacteriaceae bacterium]|nr:S1 RNA-binding domain-containing protein [Abditibacteriaceae bacterium]